jgi:hypothetical protein
LTSGTTMEPLPIPVAACVIGLPSDHRCDRERSMDVVSLASLGATAIISAVATEGWAWVRTEAARLLGRKDPGREQEEGERLDGFAVELSSVAERDVHNRLLGYLEARLSDDVALRADFLLLVRKICTEFGLDPPATQSTQRVVATNSVVVQTSGGSAQVTLGHHATVVRWAAMTGPEAARKLEELELEDAVEALADMEPALAARRFSHVRVDRAEELLAHMDEGLAADLLTKQPEPANAVALLAGMEPSRSAAILDVTTADWAVARLAEMDPDRALVVLGAMGTKRTDDMLDAMERQQAVRLLGAVSKVLTDQARVRTTFDLAQREAEQMAAEARRQADQTIERARAEAEAILATARAVPLEEAARSSDDRPAAGIRAIGDSGADIEAAVGGGVSAAAHVDPFYVWPDAFSLPSDIFLLSHEMDGRPRINQTIMETVIVGAANCELVRAQLVTVVDGRVAPRGGQRSADVVCQFALRLVMDEPDSQLVTWIRNTRKEFFHCLAQRLADTGVIIPIAKSLLVFRSAVRYRTASDAVAAAPSTRVVRLLADPTDSPDERTMVLVHLIDLAQLHSALPLRLPHRQVRGLVSGLVGQRRPRPELLAVIDGIDAAIAATVMAPRAP